MPNDYNHLSREELLVLLEKSETENRRLKSSQGFLSQGFDHAPLPTIRITPEGIVEEVNPYTCDFFGMPRETLIGINVLNNGPKYSPHAKTSHGSPPGITLSTNTSAT